MGIIKKSLFLTKLSFAIKKLMNLRGARKYNAKRNINSDISIVTIRRVPIIFFELEVIKNFMKRF